MTSRIIGGKRSIIAWITVSTLCWVPACRNPRMPDRRNELPFGVIDTPSNGQSVGRVVEVAGWALDDSRVTAVWGFVDGRYQAAATPSLPRPDVARANPRYAGAADSSGWQLELDLGETVGSHTIVVQALDDGGLTRDLGTVQVTLIGR